MLKFVSKNALLLGLSAVACVGLVAGVNQLTASRIGEQAKAARLASLQAVLPRGHQDDQLLSQCLLVKAPDAFGQPQTRIYRTQYQQQPVYVTETVAPDGYSGDILLLAAIGQQGVIYGVRTLAHKETPGLGDKIEVKRHPWILSFNDRQVSGVDDKRFAVKKDGGEFDQFTGATITPRAVVGAVKRAALFIQAHPELALQRIECAGD